MNQQNTRITNRENTTIILLVSNRMVKNLDNNDNDRKTN